MDPTDWKTLKEMGIPDHLTCFLRNLYAGQEAIFRTGLGTMHWFKIGKRVCQGCILSLWLFNLYAEHIMWNANLDETQARIKIAGRNSNNPRYADDTTLMAESKEKLKSLLMKKRRVKKKKKNWLKTQERTKVMSSGLIISWQIDVETMETVKTFFLGQNHSRCDWSHETKRCLLLGRKAMTNLDKLLKTETLDIILTKVRLVKAMVFPVIMYGCKSWTIKKPECWRIDAFELWCWRELFRVPWTAKRSNQSILKEINPEY